MKLQVRSYFRILFFGLVIQAEAALAGDAASLKYHWLPDSEGSYGVEYRVGFTFGTHTGKALKGEGHVVLKSENLVSLQKSELRVPIGALRTGKAEMDCHLREALGLNYSHSAYPKEHVCVNDQLPLSGPDAVVYPEILLRLERLRRVGGENFILSARWAIHGVSRPVEIPVQVTTQGRRVTVQARPSLSLKDFGVEVKSFLFVSTEDLVQLDLKLQFERE